jgi:hypothetical protein
MNIIKLYNQGFSTRNISKQTGKSAATIYRYIIKHGTIRTKSEALQGSKHPFYKGGHITEHGYKYIWINRKLMPEHRHIMEKYLGRKLKPTEIIHHIDHNKLNNNIANLKIVTRSSHLQEHAYKGYKLCDICGTQFNKPSVISIKAWIKRKFCSKSCRFKGHSQLMKNSPKLWNMEINKFNPHNSS